MKKIKAIIKNIFAYYNYNLSKTTGKFVLSEKKSNIANGDIALASKILSFTKKIDIYYKNLNLNKQCEISGEWKNELLRKRQIQESSYRSEDIELIASFHERMFYNELISGLWNFGHLKNGKCSFFSSLLFMNDLNNYEKIFPNCKYLYSNIPLPFWGGLKKNQLIKFTDTLHATCSNHLSDLSNFFKNRNNSNVSLIEIGSGFGGLAEKIFRHKLFNNIFLFDIPHNLLTAYYYLGRCFGKDKVLLIDNINDFRKFLKTEKNKIFLIPTCFYELNQEIEEQCILANFGSFSEMDFASIEYYVKKMNKRVVALIDINSNQKIKKNKEFDEIISDDFPIKTESFKKIYSGKSTNDLANSGRYKVSLYLRLFD